MFWAQGRGGRETAAQTVAIEEVEGNHPCGGVAIIEPRQAGTVTDYELGVISAARAPAYPAETWTFHNDQ